MYKLPYLFLASSMLLASQVVNSEEVIGQAQGVESAASGDHRQFVSMPDQARALMRQDMLDHLSSMSEILGHLASNNLDKAAEVAENRMGRSSMGKHRASGMGPGRFMPLEMRNLGWGMHDAASEFAVVAKQGDLKSAYSALQKVTASCVACHYSYRTR